MKWLPMIFALSSCAATAWAGDIEGRWGLAADSRILRTDGIRGAVIFGRSARSAWVLDLSAQETTRHDGDSWAAAGAQPVGRGRLYQATSFRVGPRFRHYSRPDASWSRYWDLFAAGSHGRGHFGAEQFSYDSYQSGAELGAGLGVEYFTPWHFSIAGHADVLSAQLAWRRTREGRSDGVRSSTEREQSVDMSVQPVIELRAYF
jgi:hypothetical protein